MISGIYVCTADNGVGTSQAKSVALEVEFSPKIKVPSPRTPQTLYHEARLLCEIEAFPPPAINWRKDNQTIRNNGTFHVTHFASADEKTTSQLKVGWYESLTYTRRIKVFFVFPMRICL